MHRLLKFIVLKVLRDEEGERRGTNERPLQRTFREMSMTCDVLGVSWSLFLDLWLLRDDVGEVYNKNCLVIYLGIAIGPKITQFLVVCKQWLNVILKKVHLNLKALF